ncbi:serine/threonine-protein kinase [Paludisphaera mucosa]|uniref:Serine/threonine-protein kinase n=1 Tax=Paludisphaera mucosa TaxID=3030827 RepID=A0ABT6F9R2_9BACT|nr:serine/threonine-protein kinase [Paludisphaera mucosa]MDG3004329.1 serine/threonine-protein kinase [Paludisphaera mucosa]
MTPERWRRVAELFDEAVRVDPAARDAWLRASSGGDETLFQEVRRLLAQDERAERDGFLAPPESAADTATWVRRPAPAQPDPAPAAAPASSGGRRRGFTPYQAIQDEPGANPSLGSRDLARRRLRGLTTTCIVITVLILAWKYAVVRDPDPLQAVPYVMLIVALGTLDVVLYGMRPFSPAAFEAMELGMIGTVAVVYSFAQYQTMLDFSLRGDATRAQLVFNHRVLVSTVLILSYGIYAPSSWRRAASVVVSIALLPFVTLLALQVLHPEAMGWMSRLGRERGSTPLAHFGFDAMLLLILAAWSSHGAYTITRLRRQAREARRLGQYRLVRRLGAGGMGEVHLAEHQFLKRPCALKLIRPDFAAEGKALERFEREVRITAELSHPNTVEIYDYGRTEDGEYFYVMEYLPGLSLEDLVKRHGPLPPGRAVYLLRQVCLALAEAHAAGLVHRDIKPSNIFASRRGGADDVAKLLDFGLVRAVAPERSPELSEEGRILGTPMFMSPEQATGGREVDARSDIYSLGAVAYYLLTGAPPFAEGGTIRILIAVARDPVAPPSTRRPGVPDDLERIVLKCLAKEPDDRFPDVRDLERALAACACAGDWDADRAAHWWSVQEPEAKA